jgi:predicted nucleic acid-binding protein
VTSFLLDTNILSELRKPKPDRRVVSFVRSQPLESLHVSIVTFAEVRFGIELVTDVRKRAQLNEWLDANLRPLFEHRVIGIDEDVMLKWRLMVEDGRRIGHTFSQPDLLIAAAAATHGLTVATRDTTEYELAGVPVYDPWQQQT